MATTDYNAGIDSSDLLFAVNKENEWGTALTSNAKYVRVTGESLSSSKSRTRPSEINANGYVAHALTTQVEASGAINVAFSAGTFDDLFTGAVSSTDWSTDVNFTSAATTGVITVHNAGTTALTTLTGSGFAVTTDDNVFDDLVVGQWIRVEGFPTNAANNGYFLVTGISSSPSEVQVSETYGSGGSTLVDAETNSDGSVTIKGSVIRNAAEVQSYSIQKQFTGTAEGAGLYLLYTGAYCTGMNISAQVGGFVEGSFSFLAKSEANNSTNSLGTIAAADSGRVIDTVTGLGNLEVNGAAAAGVIQGIDITVTKEGARQQFGIGSADAQGMGRGTLSVSGTMTVYFTTWTLYDFYDQETDVAVSFRIVDDQGDGYFITLPAATLMNPTVVAGGPDTDVVAEFELEGNPDDSGGDFDGVTIQIDRFSV